MCGAVSVKMNVLLYAPPLLLLLLKALDSLGVISAGAGAAIVQVLLGLPFIMSYPAEYISRAFNLGRVFIHFWYEGGLFLLLRAKLTQMKLRFSNLGSSPPGKFSRHKSDSRILRAEHIATTMFVGNLIGIVCARSLHYQFYSWYFYSLPYLLWRTPFPTWLRLILFAAVEFCWNVFPSNAYSSILLLGAHLTILGGIWMAPPEYPYADDTNEKPASLKKKAR